MTEHRRFKDELYAEFARVGAALASPRRLELLDLLAQRERTVEDLAGELQLSVANASQHLRALLGARLVTVRREGHHANYQLAGADVFRMWQAMREVAHSRLAEIDAIAERYLGDRSLADEPDARALMQGVSKGKIVLLDVRPVEEYQAGHLPGARSWPPSTLRGDALARLNLSKKCEVLAYCRGPYCTFADEAVDVLRAHGFRARRLRLGVPDWRALGAPVAVGAE